MKVSLILLALTKELNNKYVKAKTMDETKTENLLKKLYWSIPSDYSYQLINPLGLNESVEKSATQPNAYCASMANVIVTKCGCQTATNVQVKI